MRTHLTDRQRLNTDIVECQMEAISSTMLNNPISSKRNVNPDYTKIHDQLKFLLDLLSGVTNIAYNIILIGCW